MAAATDRRASPLRCWSSAAWPPRPQSPKSSGAKSFVARVGSEEQYGNAIQEADDRVGASCDLSRERFTLDPGLSTRVRERRPCMRRPSSIAASTW